MTLVSSFQVLLSLRLLLMMKPHVLSRVSREVAYGLHELLKTNAANIHCTHDWYTLFSLLECIGAGLKPPASFQLASSTSEHDTGSAASQVQVMRVQLEALEHQSNMSCSFCLDLNIVVKDVDGVDVRPRVFDVPQPPVLPS